MRKKKLFLVLIIVFVLSLCAMSCKDAFPPATMRWDDVYLELRRIPIDLAHSGVSPSLIVRHQEHVEKGSNVGDRDKDWWGAYIQICDAINNDTTVLGK